ncbi:MAG: hypothetical protein V1827_02845 [Candidatus Micrarchaeota archaeon]
MDREDSRQLFHILVGLLAIAVLFFLGRGFLLAAIFFTLIIGTLLINARLLGARIGIADWFVEEFEREDAPLPGWGSACYAAGALIAVSFLTDTGQIASVLLALGIGDGISTIAGRRGRMKLPYNGKKTFEGALGIFFPSLLAWFFIGPLAIPFALIAMSAESIPRLDDNLTIPALCTAFLMVAA